MQKFFTCLFPSYTSVIDPDVINSISLDKKSQELTIEFKLGTSSKWFTEAKNILGEEYLRAKSTQSASSAGPASYSYKVITKAGPRKVKNFLAKITESDQNPHLNWGQERAQSQIQQVTENLAGIEAKINLGQDIDVVSTSATGFGGSMRNYGSNNK